MKTILSLMVISVTASTANAASWELRRITVGHNDSKVERYVVRCNLTPGQAEVRTEVGGIEGVRKGELTTSVETIQRLVDAAPGVPRPDLTKAESYTNWWVRSSPTEAHFRLIRSNVKIAGNASKIYADESDSAKQLAVFMGINCFRSFGQ